MNFTSNNFTGKYIDLDAIYIQCLLTTPKKWQISYNLFNPAFYIVPFWEDETI